MRKLLWGAAAIGIAAVATPAAATEQAVWEGFVYLTNVKETTAGACTGKTGPGGGLDTGFFASALHAVFKPAGLVNNGADTKLLLITNRSAFHHLWAGKSFGPGNVPSTGFGGTANIFTYTSTFVTAILTPAAPTAKTPTIVLKAKISNFFGSTGCTATIAGSLGNRPNLSY
jgi:hypothetical protein